MGLQGDLNSVPLADVMQAISANERAGTLYVSSDEAACIMTFAKGSVTTASALESRFRLGTVLCQRGIIDPIILAEAMIKQKHVQKPLGETLLEMGLVSKEALQSVVRDQIQNIMNDVFRWKTGGFLFADEEPKHGFSEAFPVHPLLMEALRTSDEWEQMAARFADKTAVPRFASPDEVDSEGQLPPGADDALALMEMIDGFRSIDNIIQRAGWNEPRALRALTQVVDAGLVRLSTGTTTRSGLMPFQPANTQVVPVMPRAGARAVAMATIENPDDATVRELALSDPGIACALLRAAGIMGDAKPGSLKTMGDVVETLGPEFARRALVGAGLRGVYSAERPAWEGFWRHSLAVSVAARLVARLISKDRVEIDVARIAGLVHDMGSALLRKTFADRYELAIAEAKRGMPLLAAERKHLGFGHDSVGAHALEGWGVSADVHHALLHHHSQTRAIPKAAAIVAIADAVAKKHGYPMIAPEVEVELPDPAAVASKLLQIPADAMGVLERNFVHICAAREPLW